LRENVNYFANMKEFISEISDKNAWIFQIFITLLVLILIDLIFKLIIKALHKKHIGKEHWKSQLDYILLNPVKLILLIIAIYFIYEVLAIRFGFSESLKYITPWRNVALCISVAWIIMRWKKEIQKAVVSKLSKKKRALDQPAIDFIGKIFTMSFVFVVGLVILSILGIDIMPLVAFGGIGAAAIGFAAKDMIANFFGGMMLHITRPAIKGDLIDIPEKNILAVIEQIGWYMTAMKDLSQTPIYIPNSIFATASIKNLSRISHRRIEETFSLAYEDSNVIPKVLDDIRRYLYSREDIDHKLQLNVNVQKFADYSVEIYLRCYVLETRFELFLQIKQEVFLEIKKILDKHGIKIPYPIMTYISTND